MWSQLVGGGGGCYIDVGWDMVGDDTVCHETDLCTLGGPLDRLAFPLKLEAIGQRPLRMVDRASRCW